LQHAPSHLQRQAFLEQISSLLRKILAINAVKRDLAPEPIVIGNQAIFAIRGDVQIATNAKMTRSCGRA
jgi:hypothetical protein